MKVIVLLSAAILVAGCAHGTRPEAAANARHQDRGEEARLAAALAGRTAGAPQDCLSEWDLGTQTPYGSDVILFRDRLDQVIYVNRPPVACPGLAYGMAIKVQTPMSRLCRGDLVTVFDPVSGMATGGCSLGAFTPYRRAAPPKKH